jgi:hypothetical protein
LDFRTRLAPAWRLCEGPGMSEFEQVADGFINLCRSELIPLKRRVTGRVT